MFPYDVHFSKRLGRNGVRSRVPVKLVLPVTTDRLSDNETVALNMSAEFPERLLADLLQLIVPWLRL